MPKLTTEITGYSLTEIAIITNVISDGGSDIFQKGICWSTYKTPTLADFYLNEGSGSGSYESILPLFDVTTYYIRSYAVNGAGIGYSTEESFSLVRVSVDYFGDITGISAFFRANILSVSEIISRGICWSTSVNPTVNDSKTNEGTGAGIFTVTLTGLTPGTTYHVRPYASNSDGVFYGEDIIFKTKDFPILATKELKNAGTFVVTSGGDIINSGGAIILKMGVCWSTNPSPTVDDSKTDDNLYYSTFNSNLFGLQSGTTYYIRAYATNIAGTGYGNERIVTMPAAAVFDLDGNPYSSVTIGTQVWIVENLKTTKYANGDAVTNITDQTEWRKANSGAWSYYENKAQFEIPYGKLYNWFAITDSRNICPGGWHAPNDEEWTTLINFLGGNSIAGGKLKESGTVHWIDPNTGATNSSGFTALPGGGRMANFYSYIVCFNGMFWSTAASSSINAVCYALFAYGVYITRSVDLKQNGFSVRCIKNN